MRVREVLLALRFVARSARWRMRSISSADGFSRSVPLPPSRMTGVPLATSSARGSMPASAGMPSERARIATCEVAPPRMVAKPTTAPAVQRRGVGRRESSAMRIEPSRIGGRLCA